jgi:DNA-binding response OmpR family regulator
MAKILVVDDQDDFRTMITEYLSSRMNHVVTQAEDGESALEMLNREPVDLIIIDQKMPRLTGLDVIARARAEGATAKFILLTSWDSPEISGQVERLGGEYLPKNIPLEILLNETMKMLRPAEDPSCE